MNNEPVAWMYKYGSGTDDWDVGLTKESDQDIPLYTHPVKEESEQQSYQETDGCPTELAVLQRFWREHHPVKEQDEPNWKEMYWWMHALNHKHWSELSELKAHSVKELTDEEITAIWQTDECYQNAQAFAKAILRKAQEK